MKVNEKDIRFLFEKRSDYMKGMKLSTYQIDIIEFIRKQEHAVTWKAVAEYFDKPPVNIHGVLARLTRKGYLKIINEGFHPALYVVYDNPSDITMQPVQERSEPIQCCS
ncbi:MAG: hypothetical protein GY804_03935 [Alphaproteobacteria bacterium]|nr:hypothetical protein [Alphaproteobacteria bacterium]